MARLLDTQLQQQTRLHPVMAGPIMQQSMVPIWTEVSITHGNPHNHIWSFATGAADPRELLFTCP